jgi:hypothetical protein
VSSIPVPNPNVSQIPQPVANLGALVNVTQVMKQGVDSLAGNRGRPTDRAVTFNDLINLGVVVSNGGSIGADVAGSVEINALGSSIAAETLRATIAEQALRDTVAAPQQWTAGSVHAVAGASISGGTLDIPPQEWTAGSVHAVSGAAVTGGTLDILPQEWRAGTVTAVGTGLAIASNTLSLSSTVKGAVLPLVNGDLPGPAFIADPHGQSIGVPI